MQLSEMEGLMNTARKLIVLMGSNKKNKQKQCIKACQDCAEACEKAVQYHTQHPSEFSNQLINIIKDCLAYTTLMADFFERESIFSKRVCDVGISICENCLSECNNKKEIEEITRVSQACVHCIDTCRSCLG